MLKVPEFASQAEEVAWWEANENALAAEFDVATAEGKLGSGMLVIREESSVTKIIFGSEDIAMAREQAAERKVQCHTYFKMIIHEALRDAEQKRKAS